MFQLSAYPYRSHLILSVHAWSVSAWVIRVTCDCKGQYVAQILDTKTKTKRKHIVDDSLDRECSVSSRVLF
ncbi:hypothetical protein EDB87DRAFT_1608456 [Lactarius vividus]|nr:hypothetical protein EDB87DRAFT_1608456 [Lactarius vividus]